MKTVEIKGVRIGKGVPKTIVSLMGADVSECLAQAEAAVCAGADLVEWRADFARCVHDHDAMVRFGQELSKALPETPLLFTFRSACQGGVAELTDDEYISLNQVMIESGTIDLVDIEERCDASIVEQLVQAARAHGVATVVSHHDFEGTPDVETMRELLVRMARMGADVPKLAVMAHDAGDALCLLQATEQAHRDTGLPLITMAMGRTGTITRLVGEAFGSTATFCSLKQASAPGQVDLAQAKRTLNDLHEAIERISQTS
ncbi:MAG: type I 3-dehydroquinate dehydratase [Eggerthellaceae bacterium]|nr:type I 3-dehydroquinate dehydratase [Eggerthellaceae bacterium]